MTREEFLQKLPSLTKHYQPAGDVVEKLSNLTLLMIIGPSGVGKSTIIDELGITYVISDTTRPIRPGEQEGIDFYFRPDYERIVAELKAGQFAQVAVDSGGDLKASKAEYYPNSGRVVMAIVADVVLIMRQLGFEKTISAFIVPPSYQEWMRRMQNHPVTQDQLAKRLTEAKNSFNFALKDNQINFILNDDLPAAIQQTKDLLDGKMDISRENQARQAAEDIYKKLLKS